MATAETSSGAIALPSAPRTTDPASRARTLYTIHAGPVIGLIAQVSLLAALAGSVGLRGAGWVVGVTCGVITSGALAHGLSRYRPEGLRQADWVTLARASLAVGVAALVADSFDRPAPVTMLVSLSALSLALDAVDGWVAGPREGVTAWAFAAAGLGAQRGVTTAVVYGVMVFVACLPGAVVLVVAWFRRVKLPARAERALRETAAHA